MEQLQRTYLSIIDKSVAVMIVTGILLVAGIVFSGLQSTIVVSANLQALVLEGNLLFGVFLATSVALVYAGWRFDNQPGRAIVVAVISVVMGGIINMLFTTAVEGGWLPAWFGVLLGAWVMILFGAWKIQARFTLAIIGMTIYAIITTAGFLIGLQPLVSAPMAVGLLSVGLLAFVFACLIGERVIANIATRREAPEVSIREGASDSLRMVLIWGLAAICVAAPAALTGGGPFYSVGLVLLVGASVSIVSALAFPACLLLVKGGTGIPPRAAATPGKRRK
ncbi:MAG: hypothetical protein HOH43_13165 [Candidatus Latescibacteria bacterium]|nr:hypothetical protein [Candidatus Latescibacterota bacterium]